MKKRSFWWNTYSTKNIFLFAILGVTLCGIIQQNFVKGQSSDHDPYTNVISNPYTSDHNPFRFGQPTSVEIFKASPASSSKFRKEYADAKMDSSHTYDQNVFSMEKWENRCHAPCYMAHKNLERIYIQPTIDPFTIVSKTPYDEQETFTYSTKDTDNDVSLFETHFSIPSVKKGILATHTNEIISVDINTKDSTTTMLSRNQNDKQHHYHPMQIDIFSVCICPNGKNKRIYTADVTVSGKAVMPVSLLSYRFQRQLLEEPTDIIVDYHLPGRMTVTQDCNTNKENTRKGNSRLCEPPVLYIPRIHIFVDDNANQEKASHGGSNKVVKNAIDDRNDDDDDEHDGEYSLPIEQFDVDIQFVNELCRKSLFRREELQPYLKQHVILQIYDALASCLQTTFAQVLMDEGFCAFPYDDVRHDDDNGYLNHHDMMATSDHIKDGGDLLAPFPKKIVSTRQPFYLKDEEATVFEIKIPIGWHRPLAVGGIEQVFRLDGFEPTVVFVDTARLRNLYLNKTSITPFRLYPMLAEFQVHGSVVLDLGISVVRKHRAFFGRSICTSEGSCLKVPWYGDQYYTQPFADMRDIAIYFSGTAKVQDDGYANLSHLDGDLQKLTQKQLDSDSVLEFRPDVEIGKHIWIKEVVHKEDLAASLVSEGVIMSILDNLRREVQFELDQYEFVPHYY